MRRRLPLAAAVLAAAAGVTVASPWADARPTKSQALFQKALLADARTTAQVRALLSTGGGFVAPDLQFGDVTGDGRSDAIVMVETGGAAGAVAMYLFSTHGEAEDADLRAVYRSQRLYRAAAALAGGGVTITTPRFRPGDDLCCPDKLVERRYTWSAAAGKLVARGTREVDGPSGDAAPDPG